MKVVILTYKFPPRHLSGLEMGADFMARHLAERGHDVHVVVTRRDAGQSFHLRQNGHDLWRIPVLPIPFIRSLFELFMSSLMLLYLRPQVIHGQALIPCGLLSGFWGCLLGKISVMYLYGRDVIHPNRFLRETLGRRAMRWNTHILAATRHCLVNAEKLSSRDIHVFYSGFEPTEIEPVAQRDVDLLFVGRLVDVKQVDVLLRAMKQLEVETKLHLIGDGRDQDQLKQLSQELGIDDRLTWHGSMNNAEVLKMMSRSRVLVLPSSEEPFGVVLIEALSQGCRVVASHVGGIPEIVTSDERGLLVPSGDSKALAEAIDKALAMGPVSEQVVCEINDFYHWKSRMDELESYYLKVSSV